MLANEKSSWFAICKNTTLFQLCKYFTSGVFSNTIKVFGNNGVDCDYAIIDYSDDTKLSILVDFDSTIILKVYDRIYGQDIVTVTITKSIKELDLNKIAQDIVKAIDTYFTVITGERQLWRLISLVYDN